MKQLYYKLYDDDVLITQFGAFAYITEYKEGFIYSLRVVLRNQSLQWFDFYTENGMVDLSGEDDTTLFTLGG